MAVIVVNKQRFTTTDTHNAITLWFSKHYQDSPDKLRQNKTWQIIRCYIDKMGHYKAKKRGKPDYNIKYKTTTSTGKSTTYEEYRAQRI